VLFQLLDPLLQLDHPELPANKDFVQPGQFIDFFLKLCCALPDPLFEFFVEFADLLLRLPSFSDIGNGCDGTNILSGSVYYRAGFEPRIDPLAILNCSRQSVYPGHP